MVCVVEINGEEGISTESQPQKSLWTMLLENNLFRKWHYYYFNYNNVKKIILMTFEYKYTTY